MDLNAIKSKLAGLNNKGQEKEKVDYDKVFWKPSTGKTTIRIVPSAYNASFPFTELKFHYNISKFPMIALSNYGKQDPIEEFVKELRSTSDKDNWSLSGKLSPKTRIFAPVIVRGEEDKGVRLWSFGVNIYKALLALAEDDDIGDFTDVINGWDMVVEQTPGNPYPTTTVRIKPKTSALTDNKDLLEKWLKEQPNPLDCYTPNDYEFIKKQLMNYLDPESGDTATESEAAPTNTNVGVATEAPKTVPGTGIMEESSYSTESATLGKKSAASKFDDLFN